MASQRQCGLSRPHSQTRPAFWMAVQSLHGHELPVSFFHPSSRDRMKKERQADLGPGASAPPPRGTETRVGGLLKRHLIE